MAEHVALRVVGGMLGGQAQLGDDETQQRRVVAPRHREPAALEVLDVARHALHRTRLHRGQSNLCTEKKTLNSIAATPELETQSYPAKHTLK